MNLGALLVLVKLVQDTEIAKPTYLETIAPFYKKEKALYRAEQGLGL